MKRRSALIIAVIAALLGACGSSGQNNVTVGQSDTADSAAPDVETRSTAPEAPKGPLTDLVGDDASVAIDHLGQYEWTSSVVLPYPPQQYNSSEQTDGDAEISRYRSTLVEVDGGYSLRVTFNVDSYEGSPVVTIHSQASGPVTSSDPGGNQ